MTPFDKSSYNRVIAVLEEIRRDEYAFTAKDLEEIHFLMNCIESENAELCEFCKKEQEKGKPEAMADLHYLYLRIVEREYQITLAEKQLLHATTRSEYLQKMAIDFLLKQKHSYLSIFKIEGWNI